MAITRQKKEEVVAELKDMLQSATSIIAADNLGMSVEQVTKLRVKAREVGCGVKIAKNRLIRLALSELGRGGFESSLIGPTILVTHVEDAAGSAKLLVDFAKDCDKIKIKGAMLRGDVLNASSVERLAKLPGRDHLRSEFVGLVNNLVGTVYFNAQNLLSEFAGLVSAQKDKLEKAA